MKKILSKFPEASIVLAVVTVMAMTAVVCPNGNAATTDQKLHTLIVKNPSWKTDFVATATAADTSVVLSDFNGWPTSNLVFGASVLAENFEGSFVGADTGVSVRDITVKSGAIRGWSELSFNDGQTTNTAEVGFLPDAIGKSPVTSGSTTTRAWYEFAGIETTRGKSTYIAFIPSGASFGRAQITVYDGSNTKVATEYVDLNGFTWYRLQTSIRIGRITIENSGLNFGYPGATDMSFYAVAFVGRPEGGRARVEVPQRVSSTTIP